MSSRTSSTLCLACSSSLLPKAYPDVFTTSCCSKPICPTCLSSNPRLARYNPCLACLGGVGAINKHKGKEWNMKQATSRNIDGAVRDEDTFVVGDDEDDMSEGEVEDGEHEISLVAPDHPHNPSSLSVDTLVPGSSGSPSVGSGLKDGQIEDATETQTQPVKYYIKRGDTLQGISLRHNIDGRKLCLLNKLPPSTLSTTPHLLHTRTFIMLPTPLRRPTSSPEPKDEVRRARERAEKRLQTLTKEVDWRVAKAYVALADDADEAYGFAVKNKENGLGGKVSLESIAIARYLDDAEWEEEERRQGRGVLLGR